MGSCTVNRFMVWHLEAMPSLLLPAGANESMLRTFGARNWWAPGEARRVLRFNQSHGNPVRTLKAEYRVCRECGRGLVGSDAEALRKAIERDGIKTPCGPNCAKDKKSGLWQILKQRKVAA